MMNEIVEHETDSLIIKKLSQIGKRSIGVDYRKIFVWATKE